MKTLLSIATVAAVLGLTVLAFTPETTASVPGDGEEAICELAPSVQIDEVSVSEPIEADGYDWDKACRDQHGFCVASVKTCKESYKGKVVAESGLCKAEKTKLPVCCKK